MDTPSQPVVIVDFQIPFLRLVLFLVKLALAAIPAAIIPQLVMREAWQAHAAAGTG